MRHGVWLLLAVGLWSVPSVCADLAYTATPLFAQRGAYLTGLNEAGDFFWSDDLGRVGYIPRDSREMVPMTGPSDTGVGRSGSLIAFNNARQAVGHVRQQYFHNPNVLDAGSVFVSGNSYWMVDFHWIAVAVNNAGRVLAARRPGLAQGDSDEWAILDVPGSRQPRRLQPPLGGSILGAWNDFEQTVVTNADGSYLWNTRTGEAAPLGVALASARLVNGTGCVAGNAQRRLTTSHSGSLVLACGGNTIVLAEEQEGVSLEPVGLNDRGWLLYRFHTEYLLWDGEKIHILRDLLPAHLKDATFSIVGPNNDGTLGLTVFELNQSSTYRLDLNTLLDSLPVIAKPEAAGTGISGHGEYFGCEAATGWVRDWDRPGMPLPVELYEGTRLIAAATARFLREGWESGYQIDIPPSAVRDGRPHYFEVRYGGTSTVVDGAAGTVQCPSN